jgi:hypothetical protein
MVSAGSAIAQVSAPAEVMSAAVAVPVDDAPTRVEIYVDCVPNQSYESLWTLVDQWCQGMARHFNVPDIRQAPQDSPIGFGKWKAALEAMIRDGARDGAIPVGAYVLDTRGSEIAEVVAVALRLACDEIGALYVRGSR